MLETINSFLDAYGRRRLDDCLACVALGDGVMAYGTNQDERRVGRADIRAQLLRDWSQTKAGWLVMGWHHEVRHGDEGWVAADLEFRFEMNGELITTVGRATFVLICNEEGKWKIEHMHFSLPAKL